MSTQDPITQLGIQPVKLPNVAFANFPEPGSAVVGALVHYHPTHGAENYERTRPVGVLLLKQADGTVAKIALESAQLAAAVANAVALAKFEIAPAKAPFAVFKVVFDRMQEGKNGSYKHYDVRVGLAADEALHQEMFGMFMQGVRQ